jgi:hypothetical protein
MNRKLLEQALEALEAIETSTSYNGQEDEIGVHTCCYELSYKPHASDCWTHKQKAAIAAIRAELANPKPEPVAEWAATNSPAAKEIGRAMK